MVVRSMREGTNGSTDRVRRRTFMKALGSGAVLGAAGLVGTASAVTTATIRPSDGFATVAPWLESSDPDVYRIQNATRSEVEAAFTASGPRVVVFETSGVIDLGGQELEITEDNCWVAGQTAPSPGITFIKGQIQVAANDCVVQHIRTRHGPGADGSIQSNDSINTADGTQNNVLDHVTASWGTDECLSVGYDTQDTTVTNCLVYEGLWDPYGDGSDHNYATLVGNGASNVTLAGNIWAKARSRLPRLKDDTSSALSNNLMYFFNESVKMDGGTTSSIVGNVLIPQDIDDTAIEGGNAYLEDNVTDPTSTPLTGGVTELSSRPLWPSGLESMPSGSVEEHNLNNAGARPADRTSNDARIVQEIRERQGDDYLDSPRDYWIPHPDAVGGYPDLPENSHSLDVPNTGLREWLAQWSAEVETGGSTGGDYIAPTTPGSLTAEATQTSVDLSWGASSDSDTGLAEYRVTVDGTEQVLDPGTTSLTVDELDSGTYYQASVIAVDGAGNQSAAATTSFQTEYPEGEAPDDTRGSHFLAEDGFADTAWFDDSVEVIKISELAYEPIQAAFEASGPRLIVFEESGVLDLQNQTLEITSPNCYVAGQSAPSPGVTFINGFLQVAASDVVVEHIRVFRGDESGGEGTDPMNSADGTQNVIFNHCTAFWGRDENLSVGYDSDRTTLANCMIAEGLEDPEENSNGTLVGNGASDVAIMGTIYAKNNDRNPRLKENSETAIVNNLNFYHDKATWIDPGASAAIVGTAYIHRFSFRDPLVFGEGSVYFDDNYVADPPLDGRPFQDVGTELDTPPLWPNGLDAMASAQTEAHNLANAGARPADRIGQEAKIVQQIEDRWGSLDVDPNRDNAGFSDIPDSVEEAGGYPDHDGTTRELTVPEAGLRQWIDQLASEVEPDDWGDGAGGDDKAPTEPGDMTVVDSGLASITVSWSASTDSGGAGLWRYNLSVDGQQRTSVEPGTTEATISGLDEDTSYEIGVSAVDGAGNESSAATVTATTESADADKTGGRGPITVSGAGEDIWNSSDEGHLYYGAASGDFDIAVRVDSIENTDEFAKAGLMVRESTAADAANVMVRRMPDATSVQWRSSAGASTASTTSSEGEGESEISGGTTQMAWQRLVRSGDTIRAYVSENGQEWTLFADLSVGLGDEVVAGLAVTSHSTGTLCAAEFSSFSGVTLSSNDDLGSVDTSGSVDAPEDSGPGPIDGRTPTDPDGDGLYEDVNGDGEFNFPDINTLFQNTDSAAVQSDAPFYDFSDDGAVDLQDVLALFETI
ncbi:fibronectin type III domain-containing protein [Halococcoides cellulosivorans]|uniref:fibronectin type III domain-containing protein n=1 Tax=Halococcoides cellulosivorans TaxID=1679096 RepID=UPI00131F3B49|nr:fibronectin type III domain-containing protein [Halococcoides cellulosivorans]